MTHVCRNCSRVNPPDTHFCYFDGVALDLMHQGGPVAAGAKPFPTPFVFPSGQQCGNFDELARTCDADWDAAQNLLHDGFFESFLGGLGLFAHGDAVPVVLLADLCHSEAPRRALQQAHAQACLERDDAPAQP